MSTPAPFHVICCPDPLGSEQRGDRPVALYAWTPAGENIEPPERVRAALWAGLAALGDRIGFLSAGTSSHGVWRETRQGWLARRLRPLPGLLWSSDPQTFDRAFSEDWQRGGQVLWALRLGADVPEIREDRLLAWIRTVAFEMPPMPQAVRLAVRSGTGGRLCTVFAGDAGDLAAFSNAFGRALDPRRSSLRLVREHEVAATLARFARETPDRQRPPGTRWFRKAGTERMRR